MSGGYFACSEVMLIMPFPERHLAQPFQYIIAAASIPDIAAGTPITIDPESALLPVTKAGIAVEPNPEMKPERMEALYSPRPTFQHKARAATQLMIAGGTKRGIRNMASS